MLNFIMALFGDLGTKLGALIRTHLVATWSTAVLVPVVLAIGLTQPQYGSASVKYALFHYMAGDASDVAYIMDHAVADPKFAVVFTEGARRAGFFREGDRGIVDRWADAYSDQIDLVDERKLPAATFAAILEARDRAELRNPPFQVTGMTGYASSPSCERSRPPFGQIFVRTDSHFAQLVRAGDVIRVSRADRAGRPVFATVNFAPDMPKTIDLYLNRRQMIDYLGFTDTVVRIRASITRERQPNQDEEDRYPPDVAIDCSHG